MLESVYKMQLTVCESFSFIALSVTNNYTRCKTIYQMKVNLLSYNCSFLICQGNLKLFVTISQRQELYHILN